ncbi:MAG TPA: hypothetical protein VGS27_13295 [Candidatus Sulfotelmatobacter sp.]|nr:hypothetical protein [Candidatus Sulfotelmatobacter sp.]
MGVSTSISRFANYYKRNGLGATLRRISLAAQRAFFSSRMVLFYCDLAEQRSANSELPSSVKVVRVRKRADLSQADFEQMVTFWNPKLAQRNMMERFALGASLWLIKYNDSLAGYGWTLQGRTVEPHYFPLTKSDVQFLDFHVFPKYRGRALDWCLMTYILHQVAVDGCSRAFGEAAEWNKASLASFGMTPFRRLSSGRKFTILGHTIICWATHPAAEPEHLFQKAPLAMTGRKEATSITDPQR